MATVQLPRPVSVQAVQRQTVLHGYRVYLCLVVAAAFFLAFASNGASYGADEIFSLVAAGKPLGEFFRHLRVNDIHPPGSYLLLKPWVAVFGTGEFAARALPGCLFLATGLVMFLAGRWMGGWKSGVLVAVLYMTSPLAMLSAQILRMYALLGLCAAVSTWAFVRAEDERRWGIVWAAANALGLFVHIWYFFLLAAQAATYLLMGRYKNPLRMLGYYAAGFVPYAVLWLPSMIEQAKRSTHDVAWIVRPGLGELGAAAFMLAGWSVLVAVPVLFVKKREGERALFLRLLLLAACAVLIPFTFSLLVRPLFYSRFTIIALPALAMAVGGWMASVKHPQFDRLAVVILMLPALAVAGMRATAPDQMGSSRWAAEYLAQNASDGDWVIFGSLSAPAVRHYLAAGGGPKLHTESFPREIDTHPGFEGKNVIPPNYKVLRAEAERVADEIVELKPGVRVFVLAGFRPEVDGVLLEALQRKIGTPQPLDTSLGDDRGGYYRQVFRINYSK